MRVLLIGEQPETVDFSDPALPPGLDAAKIQAGIDVVMKDFAERGWDADMCAVRPDATAAPQVAQALGAKRYDCVVIGAGIRVPARRLELFETLLNLVHRAAPETAIAFNTRPENSVEAAIRALAHAAQC